LGALVAALLLAFTGLVADPTGVAAQTNPYQRGPAPTAVTGTVDGSFAVATTNVGRQSNWAGGTIYYPTDTSQGTFGAVVVSPGFLSGQVSWTGRRIASHGFVVFTIDTNSGFDFPGSRATQIDAALNYLTTQSTVASRIDRNRLGVMGHSMGGGGTLELARTRPTLKAIVPLQPWDLFQSFNTVRVPTMIIGAQNDTIASTASHSEPFYESVPAGTEKAYVELSGQSHLVGFVGGNATQSRMAIAWLKRWLDNDTRYSSIACTRPSGVSDFRSTCPV
jgi:predicted dienelactone hydrolase